MVFKNFKERLNLYLYDSRDNALLIFKLISICVSLTACATLVYYYGFPQTIERKAMLLNFVKFSFSFYILYFLFRLVYAYNSIKFLKENVVETIMISFLFLEGVSYNITGTLLTQKIFYQFGFASAAQLTAVFIQAYLLFTFAVQLSQVSSLGITKIKLHPSLLFVASFFFMIMGGTCLLMMPEMTVANTNLSFIDALFMSTSANCVTGLGVVDIGSTFTFKGHLVILFLIKFGGLNIIAFATLLGIISKLGVGIKQHSSVQDFANKDTTIHATKMFGKIVFWSLLIELVGAIVLYFLWSNIVPFNGVGNKFFVSLFHSVSAFNNAGLSLFTDGLYNELIRQNYIIHIVIAGLIVLGGLGFMALFDIFSIEKLRERLKMPWKSYDFSTKIVIHVTIWLIIGGTVAFYLLEKTNTLQGLNLSEKLITSLFQSITTRTAGFNTVDFSSVGIPMLVVMLFLMFVGASPSSTGGGIKTTTFAVICAAMKSSFLGKKHVELFKKTITNDLVLKSFSILIIYIAANLVGSLLLSITETAILNDGKHTILDLVFEQVSAYCTVGLSTGITASLSSYGKGIIIFSMFIGRVGTLTIAYAVGKNVISNMYKYSTGYTMVG